MSLIIGDNFSYQGKKPLDERFVKKTISDLLATPEYTIYDGIVVYVESEQKFYVYDSNNTNDATYGKWRERSGNGSSSIAVTLNYANAFTAEVNKDQVVDFADITGATTIKDIKVDQYINDKAGILAKVIGTDETTNEVQIRVLTKDTVIKNDIAEYAEELDPEINKIQTIDYAKVNTSETIEEFGLNHLIYDANGTIAKVLNKDETTNTLTVIPVTVDIALNSNEVYLYNDDLDKTIGKVSKIDWNKVVTSIVDIKEVSKNQLVYDLKGTVAKINSIDETTKEIEVVTITLSSDITGIEAYEYIGSLRLNKLANGVSTVAYIDLNTSKPLTDIKVNQFVYDEDGTLAKIFYVDAANNEMSVRTMTTSGMPFAPELKELVTKTAGLGYAIGDVIATNDSTIFADVQDIGPNGEILQVAISTKTAASTANGTGAIVDYDTVIYGAYGNHWTPLSNTSAQVAQIISKVFEYETGFEYEIITAGSNYKVGDIVKLGSNYVEVIKVGTAGELENVRYTRETTATSLGSGCNVTVTPNDNMFIIPDNVWTDSKQSKFDLTNDQGAFVEFSRLDNVTLRYAAGEGSIYKFEFDNINGVIYQTKTVLSGTGVTYVTTLPTDATKMTRDILYVSEEGYCLTNDNITIHKSEFSNELKDYDSFATGDEIKLGEAITKDKILYRATADLKVNTWLKDKDNFEEIKTDSSIIGGFIANKYYAENEAIIENNLIYTRITAGISDATLGTDIANWRLVTKLHSSGQRYVQFTIPKQTGSVNTWIDLSNMTYNNGDQSLMSSSRLIAPVSGLYYFNLYPFESMVTSATSKHTIINVYNKKGDIIASSESSGAWQRQVSCAGIMHLNTGEELTVKVYYTTQAPDPSTGVSEFGLISEDQSDNLVAEAELPNITTVAANTEINMAFTNSTNPSIMSSNGVITLPEDGSYLFDMDDLITASGGTTATATTFIIDKANSYLARSRGEFTNTHAPALTKVLSGKKGDTFTIKYSRTVAQKNLKCVKTYARLFKIKSTQQTLTSKDLYADYLEDHKNDINVLSYEDWVIRKYNDSNLTITATIDDGQAISTTVSSLTMTYDSGELSMLDGRDDIVVPVSGFYSIDLAPIVFNASGNITVALCKNCTGAGWDGAFTYSKMYSDSWSTQVSKTVWLNKGDKIRVQAHSTKRTSTQSDGSQRNKITVTLLHTGTPNVDINYPNTWPENEEVYLGNDLYGYRATGLFTSATGVRASQATTITGVENIVSQGGSAVVNSMRLPNVSYTIDAANSTCGETVFYINNLTTKSLTIYSIYNKARTNDPYDVWCTYTKGGTN